MQTDPKIGDILYAKVSKGDIWTNGLVSTVCKELLGSIYVETRSSNSWFMRDNKKLT